MKAGKTKMAFSICAVIALIPFVLFLRGQDTPATSDIVFVVDFTGTPNEGDIRAADLIIGRRNADLAAQDPPGTPLPNSTSAEKKASYLSILAETPNSAHLDYIDQAAQQDSDDNPNDIKALWRDATDAERDDAITALGGTP